MLMVFGTGYSFAGGTSDGPGAFDFTQGQTADGTQYGAFTSQCVSHSNGLYRNPFWEVVKGIRIEY